MKTKHKRNKRTYNKRKSTKYKSSNKKLNFFKVVLFVAILIAILYKISPDVIEFNIQMSDTQREEIKNIVREVLEEQEKEQEKEEIIEEVNAINTEAKVKETVSVTSRGGTVSTRPSTTQKTSGYRITSYHPGDGYGSGNKTGSGKSTKDFSTMKIGNKSVYTYQGKIVVAAATKELLNTGYSVSGAQTSQPDKHYFKYGDTLTLTFNGNTYEAIVLDSCGASMWTGEYRIDIYVPTASDVINCSNVTINF